MRRGIIRSSPIGPTSGLTEALPAALTVCGGGQPSPAQSLQPHQLLFAPGHFPSKAEHAQVPAELGAAPGPPSHPLEAL